MIQNRMSEIMGRQRKKISGICRETGLSRSTLTAMYYGYSQGITFRTLDALCKNLNCTPGDLLEVTTDASPTEP